MKATLFVLFAVGSRRLDWYQEDVPSSGNPEWMNKWMEEWQDSAESEERKPYSIEGTDKESKEWEKVQKDTAAH